MVRRVVVSLLLALAAHASPPVTAENLKLPLEFEANHGQFTPDVLYLARASSHFVYLTQLGFTVGVSGSNRRGAALRMQFAGADSSAAIAPESPLPGVSNYFMGNVRRLEARRAALWAHPLSRRVARH